MSSRRAGWDGVAVGEAQWLLPDPYATLAAAAAATTTLKLGTAVAVPLRHPLLAAGAMATVQGLSRTCRFCLGRGDGAVKVLRQEPMRVARVRGLPEQAAGLPAPRERRPRGRPRVDGADRRHRPVARRAETARRRRRDRPEDDCPRRLVTRTGSTSPSAPTSTGCAVRSTPPERSAAALGSDPDALELGCFVQVALTDDAT